jgi:hypothetical protein
MIKTEYIIGLLTLFLIINTYYDGKLLAAFKTNQKHAKMAMYGFIGLSMFLFLRKDPTRFREMMYHANDVIKYMPVSKGTADMLTPFIDFTNNKAFMAAAGGAAGMTAMSASDAQRMQAQYIGGNPGKNAGAPRERNGLMAANETRLLNSGKTSNKRCVSETKKKYVAANQGWKCGDCARQLPAWFEVDHVIRLEHGGSNHVDNLVALCRDCHGKKTAMENL